MHRFATRLLCLLLVTACSDGVAQDKPNKRVYCWNDKGRRICGDTLPPDAVDAARTERSVRGGSVRSIDRALTQEERAAALEAEKRAADEAAKSTDARRRDLAMVESYATEDDLRRSFDERITLLDESLKGSNLGTLNLRRSILTLLRQAADIELQSQPVRKPLLDMIQRQHADLLRQQAIMREQAADRAALGTELQAALQRYRALKSGTPASSG